MVVLRATAELVHARIPARKIRRALRTLREQLRDGRPLTAVRIRADGERIVVQDQGTSWNPESGQTLFTFAASDLAGRAAPLSLDIPEREASRTRDLTAEEWFQAGCELELTAPGKAIEAYRRAVSLDPRHVDGHINLGRLLHEIRRFDEAEVHYREALRHGPDNAIAAFNLGVLLEDLGEETAAVQAYRVALELDPEMADAHYNLACLFEKKRQKKLAFRHLKQYRSLLNRRGG